MGLKQETLSRSEYDDEGISSIVLHAVQWPLGLCCTATTAVVEIIAAVISGAEMVRSERISEYTPRGQTSYQYPPCLTSRGLGSLEMPTSWHQSQVF
jgi:hypothetical protein